MIWVYLRCGVAGPAPGGRVGRWRGEGRGGKGGGRVLVRSIFANLGAVHKKNIDPLAGEGGGAGRWRGEGRGGRGGQGLGPGEVGHGAFFVFLGAFASYCTKREKHWFFCWGRGRASVRRGGLVGGRGGGRVRGWGERAQARSILVNLAVIVLFLNCTKQKTVQKRKTLVVFGGGEGEDKALFLNYTKENNIGFVGGVTGGGRGRE